jgi:hypothetical protein
MKMADSTKILYSEEVLDFVRLSQQYCSMLETDVSMDQDQFIRFSLFCLPAIYSSMIRMPRLEPVFDEGNEKFVSEHDWSEVYRKISDCMEGSNDFLDIPAESEFDRSELITRKISEDMADIYQDLRDFLEVYRNAPEDVMNDALWECQNNFSGFWGSKVLRVSSALHKIYIGEVKSDEKTIGKDNQATEIDTRNWFISKRQQEFEEDGNDFLT